MTLNIGSHPSIPDKCHQVYVIPSPPRNCQSTPPPRGGFVSVVWEQTYRFRDLRKGLQVTLHKMCVTSLLCGPWADLWPFCGLYCKQFSLYLKFYQGWGLQRSGPTDSLKENGRKFAPTAPVASNFYRASFSWRAATRKW